MTEYKVKIKEGKVDIAKTALQGVGIKTDFDKVEAPATPPVPVAPVAEAESTEGKEETPTTE